MRCTRTFHYLCNSSDVPDIQEVQIPAFGIDEFDRPVKLNVVGFYDTFKHLRPSASLPT